MKKKLKLKRETVLALGSKDRLIQVVGGTCTCFQSCVAFCPGYRETRCCETDAC